MNQVKNILALIFHPISSIITNLAVMGLLSYGSDNATIHMMAQVMTLLALAALGQAFLTPSIFRLKASPTNFGYCTAIGMLAVAFASTSTLENPPIMSTSGYMIAAAITFVVLLFEIVTRLMFMVNVWSMGEEEYARHRVRRIMSSRLSIWQERIKYIVDASTGRSVIHDRHARIVESEGRLAASISS